MSSRGVNIFLLILLAFIAGMWAQENKEGIKQFVQDVYEKYDHTVNPQTYKIKVGQKCGCGTCACEGKCRCEEMAKQNAFLLKTIVPVMPMAGE